jgi:hypothetical protein
MTACAYLKDNVQLLTCLNRNLNRSSSSDIVAAVAGQNLVTERDVNLAACAFFANTSKALICSGRWKTTNAKKDGYNTLCTNIDAYNGYYVLN